ncbi:MAG: alcohol dehydrogenase catalytic domain-containing protein [Planctomycetia bacterium]|nr:alcohol dehydrogenase catalytic domain-containing protein [Planctomycetia bacterium]
MAQKMKRIKLVEPGKLVTEDVDIPAPAEGEALVEVSRCGICGSDVSAFHGKHPYVRCPVIPGHEFSGTVAALGPDVDDAPPVGTRVTAIPHIACGSCDACHDRRYNCCEQLKVLGAQADGAYAEYIRVPAQMLVPLPDGMSMDDAALVEPASVGCHAASRGSVGPDDNVLVIGAGPIGNFTMQCCRAHGAAKVLIADIDGSRLRLAKDLGADGIVDLGNESMAEGLDRLVGGQRNIDIFFDCVGAAGQVFDRIIQMARRGSRIVAVGVLYQDYRIPHLPDIVEHELAIAGTAMYTPADFHSVVKLIASKKIGTEGIITHHFTFDHIADAFDMIEGGKEKFFKIMLKIDESN